MTANHTRRFLLRLSIVCLLGWGAGAAQGVNTFEGNGTIEQLYPISEQILIDGQHYALPVAVARQATDRQGASVTLQRGMLVSFYGSISGGTYQIRGINVLRRNTRWGSDDRLRRGD